MQKILIYILLIFWFSSKGQEFENRTENLVQYSKLAKSYLESENRDSSIYFYKKAIGLAYIIPDSSMLTKLLIELGNLYETSGLYTKSMISYFEAKKIAQQNKQSIEQGLCYLGLSNINFRTANNEQALSHSIRAMNIFNQLSDTTNYISASMLTGQVYIGLERYDEATEIYTNILKFSYLLNDKILIADILDHIGAINNFQKNYDEAMPYHQKALEINTLIDNQINLGINQANIGEIYMLKENYYKALEHLNIALEIQEKLNFSSCLIFIYYTLGETYSRMSQNHNALSYYNKSFDLINEIGEVRERPYLFGLLSKHYERNNDYFTSLLYYKKSAEERDSLELLSAIYSAEELKVKYETERKEQELKSILLEKKLQKEELEGSKKTIKLQFLVIVIILIIISLVFIIKHVYDNKKYQVKLENTITEKTIKLIEQKQQIEITNAKLNQTNEELQESNATKDKFFSIIAHDLRSPFNAMLGLSNLLNKNFDKYDTNKQKHYLTLINQGIQKEFKLLENLLTWACSQSNTIAFNPKIVKLHLLFNDTIELLSQSANDKEIKLTNNISENFSLNADEDMLSTIIRNLISNAVKFTPKGGEVTINANEITDKNYQKFAEICIKDNGIGISKEFQSKLFDISKNILTLGTENEKGTGLGLILCKEFVEKQNGKIWVESEINKGSKFIFTIPLSYNKTSRLEPIHDNDKPTIQQV